METVAELFRQYATDSLSERLKQVTVCLDRLTDDQVWGRENPEVNAIGNLILHLVGNLGQYIVSAVGGAPDTRDRDSEFNASGGMTKAELQARLDARVAECLEVVRNVPEARLPEQVVAQGKQISVLAVIFRVSEHFALHTGQIMLRTKQLTGKELGFSTHNRAVNA